MVEQVGDSHGNQYECVCGQEKIAYKDTDEEQRGGWVDCLERGKCFPFVLIHITMRVLRVRRMTQEQAQIHPLNVFSVF